MEKIYGLADIYHSDNIDRVSEDFIEEAGITFGSFDNVCGGGMRLCDPYPPGYRKSLQTADKKGVFSPISHEQYRYQQGKQYPTSQTCNINKFLPVPPKYS